MADLDDAESRTMADLLAKLEIKDGEVSLLEYLQSLVKPEKVKKERFSFGTEEDDEDGGSGAPTTVVPTLM